MIKFLHKLLPFFALALALSASAINAAPMKKEIVGHSVSGQPIELWTLGRGAVPVLYIATIHGNEWAGTPLMHRLADYLEHRQDLLRGITLYIIPVSNPDGFTSNTRTNNNGVDLNRNFPATNRENSKRYGMSALSEPESQVLYRLLHTLKPARIVTMHQPFNQMDWDGPGEPMARHMAAHTIMPAKRVGARPGSLGSHAGDDLRLPIITYEMPGKAQLETTSTLWRRYGRSLVAGMRYPETISKANFRLPIRIDLFIPLAIFAAEAVLAAAVLAWRRRRRGSSV